LLAVSFARMKVSGEVLLDRAIFEGQLNMPHADISDQFSADGARFNGFADLDGVTIKGKASFSSAVFSHGADFKDADIAEFGGEKARFNVGGFDPIFIGMKARSSS
jgi:hypothetical protein